MNNIFKKCKIDNDIIKNYGMVVKRTSGDLVLVKERPKVKSSKIYATKYYIACIAHNNFIRITTKFNSFQKAYQTLTIKKRTK